jgi:hypothetical protein
MGEHPGDGGRSPSTEDENARLELPPLRLPKLGRRRKAREAEDSPAPSTKPAQPTRQNPRAEPSPAAGPAATAPSPAPPEPETLPEPAPEPVPQPEPAVRQPFALPSLPARVAVILTGAVVGVVGVALTDLSLQGCDAVRGTKSCGGGPGLLLLIVILVLMALLGGVLLALWDVSEPRGTSLLGVGVLAVVVLLGALPQEYSVWMFLVVPLICAASYLLAHWVTTAFVELPEKGPQHDIR